MNIENKKIIGKIGQIFNNLLSKQFGKQGRVVTIVL